MCKPQLFAVLLFAVVSLTAGANIMTLDPNALTLPSFSGNVYDVYVESDNQLFLAYTNTGHLYRLNMSNSNAIIESQSPGNDDAYYRINYEMARSSGWVFITQYGGWMWRFNKTNLADNVRIRVADGDSYIHAGFDAVRKIFFVINQGDNFIYVYNATTMTILTQFFYPLGGPFPSWENGTPGGWALAVDSQRAIIYIGVDCDLPTPAIIWQWSYAQLNAPVFLDWVIFGAEQCFEEGFVSLTDGRAWFYEDWAGWAGGFGSADLNFGKSWTVPIGTYVEALEYDQATNTGFFFTQDNSVKGQVFRTCLLETGPSATHEWQYWSPSHYNSILGTHWDASNNTLYAVTISNHVFTFSVGSTDCSQSPSSVATVSPSIAGVGKSIMQLNSNAVQFPTGGGSSRGSPTINGNFLDVYVESDNGVLLLLSDGADLYRMNASNTLQIVSSVPLNNGVTDGKIHGDLARSTGYVYIAGSGFIQRFNKNNFSDSESVPVVHENDYQFAIDTVNQLGFSVDYYTGFAYIYDLISMTNVSFFNYSQGTFPSQGSDPGGWALAVDGTRKLVYIGVDCADPTPAVIWQFSYATLASPTLQNYVIYGADQCFENGFVSIPDGRAWFYEDDADWAGGFAVEDLNWGKQWTVPIGLGIGGMEYDQATNTGFFISTNVEYKRKKGEEGEKEEKGCCSSDVLPLVYRVCLLEQGPGATHEWAVWTTNQGAFLRGSAWDPSSNLLWTIDTNNNVLTMSVGPTDCSQTVSPASHLVSPLAWFTSLLKELFFFFF